ncbi:mRNA-capping enzyme-like protein isoform X2 [Tanacetum coccineum]
MLQFLDQVGIDLPYDRHAHIVEDKYHRCGALNLTNINDKNLVVTIDYILDETVWTDFMSRFIPEVESNRELGFVSLRVRHLDDMFSWVFRKLDVYLIAAIVGGVVHELGDRYYSNTRKNRWLESTELTGYTESYRDLLGDQKIVGTKLSEKAFKEAALEVFQNRTDSSKWRRSFGITALMISEAARFVPFKDALAENFANGKSSLIVEKNRLVSRSVSTLNSNLLFFGRPTNLDNFQCT